MIAVSERQVFQHVMSPARGRLGNTANILDLLITNESGVVEEIVHESLLGKSDHSVLNITLKCYTEVSASKMMKYYYEKSDYENMRNKLENVSWHDIIGDGSIHEQWLHFKEYIKSLEDEFIPHRLIIKFKKHKGKFPNGQCVLKENKEKAYPVETVHGNQRGKVLHRILQGTESSPQNDDKYAEAV